MKENSMKDSVYQLITGRIIMMLQQEVVPWRQTWKAKSQWPRNLISSRPYQGINVFLLHMMNYESPFWLTFNQARQLGGTIRKHEKATPIVIWKRTEMTDPWTEQKQTVLFVRHWSVFNSAQCEGIASRIPTPKADVSVEDSVTIASGIVESMPNRPSIKHGFREAKYLIEDDCVAMPAQVAFDSLQEYYAVLFHELGHATGHEKRLNRDSFLDVYGDDLSNYPKEELCAEITSAFLCAECGIVERTIENSAAYIQHWLKQLKDDPKLVIHAAAQAQKATNYILNRKTEDEPAEVSSEQKEVV